MNLIEPSADYLESYQSALKEFEQFGMTGFWTSFGPIEGVSIYLKRMTHYQHWSGSREDTVPASVFWLVDDQQFFGHVSVRHRLNAGLEKQGGHIGYAIRPSRHRQGYGSLLLKLVLPRARSLGIKIALLTCNQDNIASKKIIEKNGGVLVRDVDVNGTKVLQYQIALSTR